MTVKSRLLLPILAGLFVLALDTGATLAQSDPAPPKHAHRCFSLSNWRGGWRAPDADTIYLHVGASEVWRLDLVSHTPDLLWPDRHLVNIVHGDDQVCAPIDLQLYVADEHGFRTPLVVKEITRLTPEEIAALPAKARP